MGDGGQGARREGRSTSTRGSPAPARSPTRYVPLRAGTDIAFLGGVINYILTNELDFREYVAAYTNAAYHRRRGLPRTPRTSTGCSPATTPRPATLRPRQLAVRRARAGRRRTAATDRARSEQTAARCSTSRGGAPLERHRGRRPDDPTLQHPRCVYQILKRHFARYTPEMVERVCGMPAEQFLAGLRGVDGELRPGAHHGAGLQRRLDAAQRRRAVHPHRRDHPAAAGQHGPAGRRRHGAARARQHPGLDRHPDAVQPAARLPADAAARSRHDDLDDVPRRRPQPRRRRASGATPTPTWSPCSRSTGATHATAGERLLLRLPAADHRRPRHLPHGAWT